MIGIEEIRADPPAVPGLGFRQCAGQGDDAGMVAANTAARRATGVEEAGEPHRLATVCRKPIRIRTETT